MRAALLIALLAASSGTCHDAWLLAISATDDREPATLALRTGMDFPISENAVAPERVHGGHRRPNGTETKLTDWRIDEATKSTVAAMDDRSAGVHVAWADTEPRVLKLDARKFNDYLLHDGLQKVLAARLDAHEEGRDAVERYRKCTKTIFGIGAARTGDPTKPTGQRLEIVPLEDPTRVAVRQTLAVRVLFDGAPLPTALLCWDHPGNGEDFTGTTWTDARGEAIVPVVRKGPTALRLVHMTHPNAAEYEWESFWASLCFTVGDG